MFTKFFERVPRILSALALLGLIGLAGIFDPQLARFSALSFLSYLCYFRFLRWFATPRPQVTAAGLTVWILGFVVGSLATMLSPTLFSISPVFGFIGFVGFLGLYEPIHAPQENARSDNQPAASSRV